MLLIKPTGVKRDVIDQCGSQVILSLLYSLLSLAFAGAIAIIFLKRYEVSISCSAAVLAHMSCEGILHTAMARQRC